VDLGGEVGGTRHGLLRGGRLRRNLGRVAGGTMDGVRSMRMKRNVVPLAH
jgi:hypothetical protein